MTTRAGPSSQDATVISLVGAERGRRSPLSAAARAVARPVAVVWPRPTVDDWGRDARLIDAIAPVAHLRWDVTVGGEQHLPSGPALIVINTRSLALTQLFTSWALSKVLDRPVRFAGRPDIVPFGPWLRRVGGILASPDEIAGALRAGQLVVVGAAGTYNPRRAGAIDAALIEPAVREQVPVHTGTTLSSVVSRQARVEIGPALRAKRDRRGPLAEVELAELAQRQLQEMLDELGGTRTGLPGLGWLGEG